MNKCKFKLLIFIFIMFFITTKEVYADDFMEINDYDLDNIQDVLNEDEYQEIDFIQMVKEMISGNSTNVITDTITYMIRRAFADVELEKECIVNMILISLISTFFSNFAKVFHGNGVSDSGFYICYIAIMTVILTIFSVASHIAVNLLDVIIRFMQALIPSFFLSVGMIGQTSAMGFYQITLIIIFFVDYVFLNIIMPALKIYLVLAMANNISKEDLLSKGIELIKKAIVYLNKTLLAAVIGINSIQGLVLPQVDGVKNTAIRKLAGTIPVVGDSSDYVTDVFMGSGLLIKNSLGTVAIIILFCICFVPVIKLLLVSVSLQLSAAAIQPIADKRIVESISCVSDTVKMMIRTLMTSALLFVITIAIVCLMTNIK